MRILRRIVIVTLFGFLVALPLAAQSKDTGSQKPTAGASQSGTIPLNTDLTVQANITAQAVLIPQKIAKAVFGGKISSEYAVVQLTINNKSPDAALIVQGVYIDYSHWALAGGGISTQPCAEEDSKDPKSKFVDCTIPSQVASEEYRVVRGQALNAATWTWRNGVVRGLTFAGSVAAAYAFTVSGTKYPKAVAGATGTFIPGLGTFWPDQTIDQINRISDLGYQTNKVISKQGSDIIVCFFPIDRFLTPGFKQIFLKEPALLLSPYQILLDNNALERVFAPRFGAMPHTSVNPNDLLLALGINADERKRLASLLPCYLALSKAPSAKVPKAAEQAPSAQASAEVVPVPGAGAANEQRLTALDDVLKDFAASCGPDQPQSTGGGQAATPQPKPDQPPSTSEPMNTPRPTRYELALLKTLGQVSLNTIRIVVDGVMTVDTTAMRAKIDSVVIDKDTEPDTWAVKPGETKTITGTITGSYLTDGTPVIQEAKADQITKVQVVPEGSNDQTLKFSFVLGKILNPEDHLTFVVEKATKDIKTAPVDSTPFLYVVPPLHSAADSAETNKQESEAQPNKAAGGGGAQPGGTAPTPGATKPTEEKKQPPPPVKR